MTASADPTPADAADGLAGRLGIRVGMTVQELGYDSDADELVGDAIVSGSGEDPVSEEYDGVVDIVLLWWREGDGDLADALVDAMAPLVVHGVIWLFTPKYGQPREVEPADIAEAAQTTGMRRTTSLSLPRWAGTKLVVR